MNNDNIVEYFIKSNNKEIAFIDFIKLINKLFFVILNKIEENNDEILYKIIQSSQNIYDHCIKEINLLKEEKYIKEIIDIYVEIIKNIIQFLFNELFPYILVILNEKENEIQNLENQFIKMLFIENKINNNMNTVINEMINKALIFSLFDISKYQTNEEILKYINKYKDFQSINENKYICNFTNFKKKCTSLLISKLNNILNEYKIEYENKKDNNVLSKIILLLNQIKNMEIFPDLMNIEINKNGDNNNVDNKEEMNKYKNKKMHLLYLYKSLVNYILIDNKEIQLIIKEILLMVFNGIDLPPLQKISIEEK